jgi:predicted Rossmann-fold nucleotide-binding protein
VIAGHGEPNAWVTRAVVAADLPDRLRLLRDLSGAAIFLPHGLGTMLELVFFAESIVKGDVPPRRLVFLGEPWRGVFEIVVSEASTPLGARALAAGAEFAASPNDAAAAALRLLK